MDASNGLSNGNHSMANMLKEMLKINGSVETSEQSSHIGAGDGIDQINKLSSSKSESNIDLEKTPEPSKNNADEASQVIALGEVADGACISLIGESTKIVSSVLTELDSSTSSSSKIRTSTITKYEWEHRFYQGNLVSVTNLYIAYILKGRGSNTIRVINRSNPSDRVLLRGFNGAITDLAFSHYDSKTIAATDDTGSLMVWDLDDIAGAIVPELKLHLLPDGVSNPVTHRLVWIPNVDQSDEEENSTYDDVKSDSDGSSATLVLFYSNVAEVWDLSIAYVTIAKQGDLKLKRSQATHAFVTVNDYDDDITDCELSPIGKVLAAASYDGRVKFWQVQIEDTDPPRCLHEWEPHDGKPVTAIRFCDDKKQADSSVYWRFLLTGCDRNIELKMWCTVTWNCMQVIQFQPSTPAHALPELNLILHQSADLLVLSDIHRKVLYVMQMDADIEGGRARISSIAHYHLTAPLLSLALVDAKRWKFKNLDSIQDIDSSAPQPDSDNVSDDAEAGDQQQDDSASKVEGLLIQLLTIQQRCLQKLQVHFIPIDLNSAGETDSGMTYNTSADDLKDQFSFSSAGTDSPRNAATPSDENLIPDQNEVVLSTANEPAVDEQEKTLENAERKVGNDSEDASPVNENDVDIPTSSSLAPPHTSTLLLTPDAFLHMNRTPGRVPDESFNTSFTSVTPFSNINSSFHHLDQAATGGKDDSQSDSLIALPVEDYSEERKEALKTPPSSPIQPRASSSPPLPSTSAADQLLPSFFSGLLVKSPDLISSTSTMDEGKQEHVRSTPVSAPPGLQRNITSPLISTAPTDPFANILIPVTLDDAVSAWPKAPDVTMSRPLVSRSSSQTGLNQSVASQASRSDQPAMSSAAPSNEDSHLEAPPQVASSHDELLASFKDFQQRQESLLIEQQRRCDVIAKKQTHLQKQSEASLRKSEQQVERTEKTIKSLADNQKRLLADVKVSQSTLIDAAFAKIDRTVKSEMKRTILPGMNACIGDMKEQLSSSFAEQLVTTDDTMKETVRKHMKSKQLMDGIASSTSNALLEQIQTSFPDLFIKTVVPAFDRSCQNMFQQLSSAYHQGMEESVKQLETQMQIRLQVEFDRLQQLTKESVNVTNNLQLVAKTAHKDLTANVNKEITANVDKLLHGLEDRITASVLQAVGHQQTEHQKVLNEAVCGVVKGAVVEKLSATDTELPASSPSNSSRFQLSGGAKQSNIFDQQQQILKLLLQRNYNAAFQTALTAADLNLVMYVCETVEPVAVFGVSPCPLHQPILLSLIQQLSSDLSTKTAIKLKYLQEAVMNLDRSHHITKEYMRSVLSALVQNIKSCVQNPLEQPSLAKDLRMLAMAAQSLMN